MDMSHSDLIFFHHEIFRKKTVTTDTTTMYRAFRGRDNGKKDCHRLTQDCHAFEKFSREFMAETLLSLFD